MVEFDNIFKLILKILVQNLKLKLGTKAWQQWFELILFSEQLKGIKVNFDLGRFEHGFLLFLEAIFLLLHSRLSIVTLSQPTI